MTTLCVNKIVRNHDDEMKGRGEWKPLLEHYLRVQEAKEITEFKRPKIFITVGKLWGDDLRNRYIEIFQ